MEITKKELLALVGKKVGIKQTTIAEVLQQLVDEISLQLEEGNSVKIKNFGTFNKFTRKSVIMTRIHDKKLIKLPRNWIVKFKPAPALKKRINANNAVTLPPE